MSKTPYRLRIFAVLASVFALVASLAFVAGSVRPTEATWQDTVHGESRFGVENPYIGQHFARSISAYGEFRQRSRTPLNFGPSQNEARPETNWRMPTTVTDSWRSVNTGGFLPPFRATADVRTCARRDNRSPSDCKPLPEDPSATSYAVSELKNLEARALALIIPVPLVTSGSTPIRATASCAPGRNGRAGLSSDALSLGGFLLSGGTPIAIPGPGEAAPITPRDIGLYTYSGVIEHVSEEKPGYARSQLRLYVEATGDLTKSEAWTFHAILAHAECGLSQLPSAVPLRPSADSPSVRSGRLATLAEAPGALRSIVDDSEVPAGDVDEAAEPGDLPTVQGESALPEAVDPRVLEGDSDGGDAADADMSAPTTSAANLTTEPASTEPAERIPPETTPPASTTEATTAFPTPTSPQAAPTPRPETVTLGREFTVTTTDGLELGTVRIDNVVRTFGCGVEITLSVTTSDETGPDRWASIGPRDFAEVRPGGTIRQATRLDPDCEKSTNSRTTALSPGRSYELVIAVSIDDSAQRAMFRPEGTVGWIVDLPPLTRVPATTSLPTTAATTPTNPAAPTEATDAPEAEG